MVALQPSFGVPAHLCVWICFDRRAGSPRTPSTASSLVAGLDRAATRACCVSTLDTFVVVSWGPIAKKKIQNSRKASTRLTAGPAAITTIRFQTGCEW